MIRRLSTDELRADEVEALRELLRVSFDEPDEPFTDDDWEHAVGGVHFVLEDEGLLVAHASVVQRELLAAGHHLETGYVEAVATRPSHRGRGFGSAVMRGVNEYIDRGFRLGALGTGAIPFYEALGWRVWRGPTYVRTDPGPVRTPDEDGFVLVRLTPTSPELDLSGPISCDWRPGDVW